MVARAAEHRSHGCQHLPEFVVQLAGQVMKRRFARRDELLRDVAALFRERCQLREETPVGLNQVEARHHDGGEGDGEERVDLALHLIVDALHPARRFLLAFVVLDQQPRDRGAECGLPGLERDPDLRARLGLVPVARQRKNAIGRIPELRQRIGEVLALLGRPRADCQLILTPQRILEIEPHALKLAGPGGQWIRFAVVQHVAHREADCIQVVLNAEQLQRVSAAPVGEVGLQRPKPRDLPGEVVRVGRDRGESDDHPRKQPRRRRSS
jgi:hypothetical protein